MCLRLRMASPNLLFPAMPNWHGEWSVRAFGVSLKQFAAALERASEARRRAR